MATVKKGRRLLKTEISFIRRHSEGLDIDVMEPYVLKEVNAVEVHVAYYTERQMLWLYLKRSKKLGKMM